jgi:acetyl esterase/lipase
MNNKFFFLGFAIVVGLILASCQRTAQPASPSVSGSATFTHQESSTSAAVILTPTPSVPIVIPATTVELVRDLEYGKGGNTSLLLDLYLPRTRIKRPAPAVIFIHGGGWSQGDKFPSQVRTLAERGFVGVSINYRLSGEAIFPAAVEDSKCAVRWLRANADEYGIDSNRVGVWGSSAGGHLVMMVGAAEKDAGLEGNGGWDNVSSQIQAVCSFFGPADFVDWYKNRIVKPNSSPEIKFLGGSYEQVPDIFRRASPETYVGPNDPPRLMDHGDMDLTVPFRQSELMYQAYQKAGLDAALIKVVGAGHGFVPAATLPISPSNQEINRLVLDFFVRNLVQN